MLFNSPQYIFLFLPLVVIIYYLLNHYRLTTAGKAWLVFASLFFYGYWESSYLLLILASILVNYSTGIALRRSCYGGDDGRHRPRRKALMVWGVSFNLGLLGWFKYVDFFIANINLAFDANLAPLYIILPLAISFFTFQQIAYLADCYQGDTREYDFLNYCLFVTFFPQLIAGPIVHHREMMPQFSSIRTKVLDWRNITTGLFIFFVGLFKKVVIADGCAVWANAGFDGDAPLRFVEAWGASLSYSFQLYYDFSGYSDMAIGAALMLNIRLPVNFNSPYKAINIQDFWRRWHMTLSRWLRDYVYIPLGGNRKGNVRTYLNIMLTFLLGGLWHGAGWTFVVWGALHGAALAIQRFWQHTGVRINVYLAWLITFMFLNLTWVFFRATSFEDALRVLRGMAGLNGFGIDTAFFDGFNLQFSRLIMGWIGSEIDILLGIDALKYVLVFGLIAFLAPNTVQMVRYIPYRGRFLFTASARQAIALALVTGFALLTFTGDMQTNEFLYFNF